MWQVHTIDYRKESRGKVVKRRVVITGLGVISSVGIGKEGFWQNLLGGVSGVTSFDRVTCCPLFRFHSLQAQIIREATDFAPVEQVVPPEYQPRDRFIQFALAGAQQAVYAAIGPRASASALEVIVCAMSIQLQRIHPTINLESSDPRCDLNSHGMHITIVTQVLLIMAKIEQGSPG
jgi:3-oxoacyl-(acyl-carrier-protein) synthase